jgi:hypothetical protein
MHDPDLDVRRGAILPPSPRVSRTHRRSDAAPQDEEREA